MSFYLTWKQSGTLVKGFDGTNWIDSGVAYPVSFPGTTTPAELITLVSSARSTLTFETMTNVSFFLTGNANDVYTVQSVWPYYGADPNNPNGVHPRADLDGGFEVSFDGGATYTRFNNSVGLQSDSNTWISLPQNAVGLTGQANTLGPFDIAQMLVRFRIPSSANSYQVYDVRLGVDFDII